MVNVGSSSIRVKPKAMKLSFDVSLLSVRVTEKTGWLGIGMFPGEITVIAADCCFNEMAQLKSK
jgi:hypothetical protein